MDDGTRLYYETKKQLFFPSYALMCHSLLDISFDELMRRRTSECICILDDGWPESVEEQGLLLLVWRHQIRNNILKMCYRQSRRGVLRQNSRSARQ